MDGNKDDAEKCIQIALKALSAGDKEKTRRFLLKAQKLYPSKKASGTKVGFDFNSSLYFSSENQKTREERG